MSIVLVNPIGDFPLNDDWAYGIAVRNLVEQHSLRLSDWTATNFIAQLFWGASFCFMFGFSFTALRISTLALGVVGVLATYGLLREAQARPSLAFFGAMTLAFNPIYFALSFTFMTDVPFVALGSVSSWLLIRGLNREDWRELSAGHCFAFAAILIRQVGFAIPLAFSVTYVVNGGLKLRRIVNALVPFFVALSVQVAYQWWLRTSDRLPAKFGNQIGTIATQLILPLGGIFKDAMTISLAFLLYLGLFLTPYLVVLVRFKLRKTEWLTFIALSLVSVLASWLLIAHGDRMPIVGNILTKHGIGYDNYYAPRSFWSGVTFASVFGAGLAIVVYTRAIARLLPIVRDRRGAARAFVFSAVAVLISYAPLPVLGLSPFGFYDRYLIIFLPWLMLLALNHTGPTIVVRGSAAVVATLLLAGIAVFSIAATHDLLAAERARWNALNDLIQVGRVRPQEIDGGFEFSGWYLYSAKLAALPEPIGDDYVVEPSVREGYKVLFRYRIPYWLPWRGEDILVQHRERGTGR